MYNFAMMLTANRSDAEDLLQETTLRVLDNQEKYVDNINFKGWVLTIMRNIFINNYRKILRSQIIIDQTEDLYHLNLSQDSKLNSPEESITIKEITLTISNLNDDLKVPFSMFLAGYKYNEISEKLDLPLGTIKSRIFFARKELQKNLKDLRAYN
jgi:RNA polymerase sigma-70 factor (ECF subfamily)